MADEPTSTEATDAVSWAILPSLLQRPRLVSSLKAQNKNVAFVERSIDDEIAEADLCVSFRAGAVLIDRDFEKDALLSRLQRLMIRYQDLLVVLKVTSGAESLLQHELLAMFEHSKLSGQQMTVRRARTLHEVVEFFNDFARAASAADSTPRPLPEEATQVCAYSPSLRIEF